jgi:hypothetical protein
LRTISPQQGLACMLKSLLANPLNGTATKALLKSQLKIATGITTDLFKITERNTRTKIGINPFQKPLKNTHTIQRPSGVLLQNLSQRGTQQQGERAVDEIINLEMLKIMQFSQLLAIEHPKRTTQNLQKLLHRSSRRANRSHVFEIGNETPFRNT